MWKSFIRVDLLRIITTLTLIYPRSQFYPIFRYVEFIKTRYISGDLNLLMFGATACRQPMNAIRIDRELRLCYTAPSETFGNPNLAPEECR